MYTQKATQQYRMNQWIKIIREYHSGGENIVSWCRNNDIKPNSYYYWLRKIRAAACKELPSINTHEQIIPVDMFKLTTSNSIDAEYVSSETCHSDIIIRFGSVVLEIGNTASPSLIENTIKVIQNVR